MKFGRWIRVTSVLAAGVLLLAHSAAAMGGKGGAAAVVIDSVPVVDRRLYAIIRKFDARVDQVSFATNRYLSP